MAAARKQEPIPSLASDLRERGGLLTLAELAALMKRHPETLKTWCRTGKIPHLRLVGRTMFDCLTVAEWLDRQTVAGQWNLAA